jgi:hypothetical protein
MNITDGVELTSGRCTGEEFKTLYHYMTIDLSCFDFEVLCTGYDESMISSSEIEKALLGLYSNTQCCIQHLKSWNIEI